MDFDQFFNHIMLIGHAEWFIIIIVRVTVIFPSPIQMLQCTPEDKGQNTSCLVLLKRDFDSHCFIVDIISLGLKRHSEDWLCPRMAPEVWVSGETGPDVKVLALSLGLNTNQPRALCQTPWFLWSLDSSCPRMKGLNEVRTHIFSF